MCTFVVQRNWEALQYVKDQTPEICMAAVKQNGDALVYVMNKLLRFAWLQFNKTDFHFIM